MAGVADTKGKMHVSNRASKGFYGIAFQQAFRVACQGGVPKSVRRTRLI